MGDMTIRLGNSSEPMVTGVNNPGCNGITCFPAGDDGGLLCGFVPYTPSL
jgi:hypothetical protein